MTTTPKGDDERAGSTDGDGGGHVQPTKKPSRFKKRLIQVGIAVGLLGLSYGVGRVQGIIEASTATEALRQEERRAGRLEARRLVDSALRALEDQNFGIASERLRMAATELERSAGDDDGLERLAGDLASTELGMEGDLDAQRAELRGYVHRFDRAVPPPTPSTPEETSPEPAP